VVTDLRVRPGSQVETGALLLNLSRDPEEFGAP
jgi:hypothetical protein